MISGKRRLCSLVMFACVISAALPSMAPCAMAQQGDNPPVENPVVAIVPGEVIVKLRPGTSQQSRDLVLSMVGGVFVRDLDLSDLVLARVPVGSEISAAESLAVDPSVLYAEPNRLLQADAGL